MKNDIMTVNYYLKVAGQGFMKSFNSFNLFFLNITIMLEVGKYTDLNKSRKSVVTCVGHVFHQNFFVLLIYR
jgi:hypothetical protein